MQKLIMVMGLPGSGKSTLSSSLNGTKIHIDEIRKAVTGTYKPGQSNDLVHQISQRTVFYHLEKGKTVILDGALLSKKSREPYLKIAKKLHIETELYWLDPSYELFKKRLIERNKIVSDDRKIDYQYVDKLSRMLEIPSGDEGFSKIRRLSDDELL